MARKFFAPRGDRYGIQPEFLAAGNAGPIAPVAVATSTVSYRVASPLRRLFIERISLLIGTLAAGAGAITIQFFVRNSVGAKSIALTAATSLTAGTTLNVRNVALTANDIQRYVAEGDYLAYDIVAASTITQQPVDLLPLIETCVLE